MSYLPTRTESRPLGKGGPSVFPIAWGMWRFAGPSADARRLVEAVLQTGVNLLDTADIYGFDGTAGFGDSERLLGEVFLSSPGLRTRMVLATKGGIRPPVPYDSSNAYLAQALDDSLARMGVEHVELYQIHRPDILTHPQEVARALEDMVTSGKVGAVGLSNTTIAQTRLLADLLTVPLATIQPELSPLAIEPFGNGLLDLAMERELAVLAWSPLGGGRVPMPDDDRSRAVATALDRKATESGVSRAATAYSWIMAHPAAPIPIVGTQSIERLGDIVDALTPRWTRTEWYEVLVASMEEPLP